MTHEHDHGHEDEHDHGDEHDHDDGHEHEHDAYDWAAELARLRDGAAHFYDHQFDWRGHEPPPGFAGPRYFPPAPEWRLQSSLDATVAGSGEKVTLATSTGQLREMTVAGQLVFDFDGREHRLTAYRTHDAEGYAVLFVPFRDATSGAETYGAGRYVDVPYEHDDQLELDFNFAYNPSCAYSPAYDCPFPPPGNRLDVAVRAGEMVPSGH